MNDTVLLVTGISVFGLMLIAIVLTVAEFNQLRRRRQSNPGERSARTSEGRSQTGKRN
jgi:hypothetical protein